MYRRRGYRRFNRFYRNRERWYNDDGFDSNDDNDFDDDNDPNDFDDGEEEMAPVPVPAKKPRIERKKRKKHRAQPIILYENPPGEPPSNTTFMDMNDHCINEILIYLDADDLCALSTQCRRLQNLTAESLVAHFPNEVAQVHRFEENGSWLRYPGSDNLIVSFANFTKISIDNSISNRQGVLDLHHYLAAKYKSRIDEIRFEGWRRLRPIHGKAFADIVENTKSVVFSRTKIIGELYKTILCHFPSMERLVLWNSVEMTCKDDEKDKWLLEKYPNLKSFSWFLNEEIRIGDEMKQFFEQNDNIEQFSLYTSRIDTLKRCDEAGIDVSHIYLRVTSDVGNVLKYLHENCGPLTKLHLLIEDVCRVELTQKLKDLIALKNNLVGLYLGGVAPSKSLAQAIGKLVRLRHLQIRHTPHVEEFASLPNLENLYVARGVVEASFHAIKNTMFTIASRAPNLKNIFLRNSCRPFSEFQFNAYNLARTRLPNATKVTIHIRTKAPDRRHEMATMQLHYDMIDIKTVEMEDVVNPLVTNWLYAM